MRAMTRSLKLSLTLAGLLLLGSCSGPQAAAPPPAPPAPASAPAPAPTPRAQVKKARPPAAGPIPGVPFPAVASHKLKNGLEVYTVAHRGLPVVNVALVIRSGKAHDPKTLTGLADFVVEMLKEGTRTRSKQKIVEQIEFVGGTLQTSAGHDYASIAAPVLKEHLDVALSLVADVAQNPVFPAREVEKVRENALNALRLNLTDPNFLASRQLAKDLYGEHPYGNVVPTEESLLRIKRADLVAFHRAHFRPNNALLIVAGDVDEKTVVPRVEKFFSRWQPKGVPKLEQAPIPERKTRTISLVDRPQSVQSAIRIGNVTIPRNHPDFVALHLAQHVLGGSASARLFLELREKQGLTYGAYTRLASRVQPAALVASANSRNSVTAKAMEAFMAQIERIRNEPVGATELSNAKRYLTGAFTLQLETAANVAALVIAQKIFGLGDGYWDRYLQELNAVSSARLQEMARKYLQPDNAAIVVVGVADQLAEPLTKWGPVDVYDTEGRRLRRLRLSTKGTPPTAPPTASR